MAELKTKPTRASVAKFIQGIKDEEVRRDCKTLVRIMKRISDAPPRMWGPSIIGFGSYRYVYESGRELDWFPIGFSPRKDALSLYILGGFSPSNPSFKALGQFKTGKGCLYVKRLSDVNLPHLARLIAAGHRKAAAGR